MAGLTDQSFIFGGDAGGTYAAGTDGGTSGTGRADYATQYRFSSDTFSIGLQTQSRSIGENDRDIAYTFQGAFTLSAGPGLKIGVAYNEVRDGVPNPLPSQSKEGDQAAVASIALERPRYYVAATYADLQNHEKDDAGVFFSGKGC